MASRFESPTAYLVAREAHQVGLRLASPLEAGVSERLLADVEAMFQGRFLDYQAIDLPYHDLEHTLQVALCYVRIVAGYMEAEPAPLLSARLFELGLAAALLHDTGYLKLRADTSGTGAKYARVHVYRGCALAGSYLPGLGFTGREVERVLSAIRYTDHAAPTTAPDPLDHLLGSMVASADYLAQMAAPDYVQKLPALYAEFAESAEYDRVPVAERAYRSLPDLAAHTPWFWRDSVLPRLENELAGVYRYLNRPWPDGPNPYLQAIVANLAHFSSPQ